MQRPQAVSKDPKICSVECLKIQISELVPRPQDTVTTNQIQQLLSEHHPYDDTSPSCLCTDLCFGISVHRRVASSLEWDGYDVMYGGALVLVFEKKQLTARHPEKACECQLHSYTAFNLKSSSYSAELRIHSTRNSPCVSFFILHLSCHVTRALTNNYDSLTVMKESISSCPSMCSIVYSVK